MEKKLREIHVYGISNLDNRIKLTVVRETDDLRDLITEALLKMSRYSTQNEEFKIDHIDSLTRLKKSEVE